MMLRKTFPRLLCLLAVVACANSAWAQSPDVPLMSVNAIRVKTLETVEPFRFVRFVKNTKDLSVIHVAYPPERGVYVDAVTLQSGTAGDFTWVAPLSGNPVVPIEMSTELNNPTARRPVATDEEGRGIGITSAYRQIGYLGDAPGTGGVGRMLTTLYAEN